MIATNPQPLALPSRRAGMPQEWDAAEEWSAG